jgi:hypothetical protein
MDFNSINLFIWYFGLKGEQKTLNNRISEQLGGELLDNDSLTESIDDISKEEIECFKNEIKSKLTDVDYETYIKQFWVGLLEGDGTITVSSPGPNQIKVRMVISIKNYRENVIMLLLIKDVLGGTVRIERKGQYISWIAISKNLIQSLIKLLEKYPLLTTRKQCQLKFATRCLENNTRGFVVENRNFMYDDQHNMLANYSENFSIPSYFSPWLSGFIEAEGNFRFLIDKRRNMQVSGRFNIGQNFERFIIKAIRDYFGGTTKIQAIISKKDFALKRQLLGEVKHYYVEMGNKAVKTAIFAHFNQYPLLGHKRATYTRWYDYFNS